MLRNQCIKVLAASDKLIKQQEKTFKSLSKSEKLKRKDTPAGFSQHQVCLGLHSAAALSTQMTLSCHVTFEFYQLNLHGWEPKARDMFVHLGEIEILRSVPQ